MDSLTIAVEQFKTRTREGTECLCRSSPEDVLNESLHFAPQQQRLLALRLCPASAWLHELLAIPNPIRYNTDIQYQQFA